ncbi:MAG: hypothetical protein PXZ08_11890 [Actinomycetota bacterium]|jgi:hypothetical protein|nr:hypothetical protein [Actinomycetota bacterium]
MASADDSFDLNLAAATLRSNNTDVAILLKVLSTQLAPTLGDRLRVERAGGRFHKSDAIARVLIDMGSETFDAVLEGPVLRCSIAHSSGGIRIRSETVGVDEWIVRLLGALQGEAAHSESARQALEKIVIGGPQ